MAIEQNIKRDRNDGDPPDGTDADRDGPDESDRDQRDAGERPPAESTGSDRPDLESGEAQYGRAASPTQLGTRRFVYAAYFAGAIGIAFLASKVLELLWLKAQSWKPAIGEPRDEVVMPVAALLGALAAIYYWNRTRARRLAEEVATEMSKVTWPNRSEVTNGTFVVIVTTIISTVFFALMDKFWGFVTNLVYGGS